ncbi:disease resistance protein Roq1-like [Cryptomeria japonica]|uniref:disease resistance protein Roq1-like n=1 Tax=Cryptomeria japonica TaxID=3369 RepID=UPI0027D9D3BD|nr:disease resistance protein Roq1-like [Cryptomeria japonica]
MTGLGQDEALELSSCHAFCKAAPETPYKRACRGHPLALEVIGAQLFDKESNDIQCWEEAVHNIGENPDIPRILQTSFDGLSHIEKEIFLDIACCFVGQRKRDTDLFWEVLYPNKVQTAIKNLSLKMLININSPQDSFHMHDLLREMGRGI